jgi:hypothetical protein
MRRFGRPIDTGKLFVQPNTNCSAPAITIRRSASVAPTFFSVKNSRTRSGASQSRMGTATRAPAAALSE